MPYFRFHQFNAQLLNFSACASIKINFLLAIYLSIKNIFHEKIDLPLYFLFIHKCLYLLGWSLSEVFFWEFRGYAFHVIFMIFLTFYEYLFFLRLKIFGCQILRYRKD